MASDQFETTESFESPSVRQFSVFLEDKVGVLLRLFRAFEGSSVRVVGMSIIQISDCSIARLICDDADMAKGLLETRGFTFVESELIVVEIPHGLGLMSICSALLTGEVNIEYAYPLIVRPQGRPVLAVCTDDPATAVQVLKSRQCYVLSENDLGPGPLR
jgi:hypothetical protein